jgi:hypothetical protein
MIQFEGFMTTGTPSAPPTWFSTQTVAASDRGLSRPACELLWAVGCQFDSWRLELELILSGSDARPGRFPLALHLPLAARAGQQRQAQFRLIQCSERRRVATAGRARGHCQGSPSLAGPGQCQWASGPGPPGPGRPAAADRGPAADHCQGPRSTAMARSRDADTVTDRRTQAVGETRAGGRW